VGDTEQTEQTVRRRLAALFAPAAVALAAPADVTVPRPSPRSPVHAMPSPHDPPPAAQTGPPALSKPLPGVGAFDPGRRGLKALAVVAALVVAVAAYLAWQARPQAEAVPSVVVDSGAPAGPAGGSPSAPAVLVVAVTGRVKQPGLVRVPAGSRVADAIDAAGGVLPGTDLSAVNLARKVSDGELIAIGVPGVPAAGGAGDVAGPGSKVNLNTATLAQLDALPGVGPVLAQRILDYRTRRGAFKSVGDLRQVEGIGDSKFEQIKDLVTV
jgi:competence protein ComEA